MGIQVVTLASHMLFVALTYRLLISVIDWSKIISKQTDVWKSLRLLIFLISSAIGFLASHLFLELLMIGRHFSALIN